MADTTVFYSFGSKAKTTKKVKNDGMSAVSVFYYHCVASGNKLTVVFQ